MFKALALATGATLFLFGCAPKGDAEQPEAKSVSAVPEPTPPAAANTAVAPESTSSEQQTAAAAEDGAEVRYSCEDGRVVLARYGDEDVQISTGGKALRLPSVMAASGAKYMVKDGLSPGKSLTWWTKGDEAMLIEAPSANPPDAADGETTVNCQSKASG